MAKDWSSSSLPCFEVQSGPLVTFQMSMSYYQLHQKEIYSIKPLTWFHLDDCSSPEEVKWSNNSHEKKKQRLERNPKICLVKPNCMRAEGRETASPQSAAHAHWTSSVIRNIPPHFSSLRIPSPFVLCPSAKIFVLASMTSKYFTIMQLNNCTNYLQGKTFLKWVFFFNVLVDLCCNLHPSLFSLFVSASEGLRVLHMLPVCWSGRTGRPHPPPPGRCSPADRRRSGNPGPCSRTSLRGNTG